MTKNISAIHPVAVIKIGGSILTSSRAFRRAARYVRNRHFASPDERLVVVVSAQEGATDRLAASANRIVANPNSSALDILWSTGELRSVALLVLHLQSLGISAAALNIHEAGLILPDRASDSGHQAQRIQLNPPWLRSALSLHPIVVVPGFFATDSRNAVVSLGRGGSDLTAVLLAEALDATRCELLKDVPGYFTSDPHRDPKARHVPSLSFEQALAFADAGCDLVQRNAILCAARSNLPLVIRSLDESAPVSRIATDVGQTSFADFVAAEAVAP
jgi:aspartate kinase